MTGSNKPNKAGGMASVTSTIKQVIKSENAKQNIKNLLKANKAGGFDCPGCAWGDSAEGMVHFCENGAKAIAWESTTKKVDPDFFAQYSVAKLRKQSDYWLEYQGRLTHPMQYNNKTDHYEAISWQQAFSLISEQVKALLSADEIEFYTSGRASNEAAFLYQLFGRALGTNNFPDCSNMCHEASGVALKESIGVGKGTVVLDDFYAAEAIFVYGQNPGSNHPRMMNALRKAAKQNCKIVSINNLKEVALEKFASPQKPLELLTPKSVAISHYYITPKLGTDIALIRGIAKYIFEHYESNIDRDFILNHTANFEAYQAQVNRTPWEAIFEQTGVSSQDIASAAKIYANSKKVISTWAMGLTQHKHSVDTIKELTNLHLLLGQIGKPGAGLCPVRGHSNVQGNRTMGINERPSDEFLSKLESQLKLDIPRKPGHNVHQALKALHAKQSKILICLGGNLAAAAPDSAFTQTAMSQAQLNVQISTKLNRSHLMVSNKALILPCLGRTEFDYQQTGPQQITVEDTFSMVHASAGKAEPVSDLCLSEIDIVARMAHSILGDTPINWLKYRDDYRLIRDLIASTIDGFEDFNQKVTQPFGFHLSNSAAQKVWKTSTQKANFSAHTLPISVYDTELNTHLQELSLGQKDRVYTMQTMRSHDQYNTTIYGMDDRYRGVKNQRNVIFMNPKDAQKSHLNEGDLVDITSIWPDNKTRTVASFKVVFYDIPRGNVAAYYPETNPLIPIDSVGIDSFTPTSKAIAITLQKSNKPANIPTQAC